MRTEDPPTMNVRSRKFPYAVTRAGELAARYSKQREIPWNIHLKRPAYKYVLSFLDLFIISLTLFATSAVHLHAGPRLIDDADGFRLIMVLSAVGFVGAVYMILHATGVYKIHNIVSLRAQSWYTLKSMIISIGVMVLGLVTLESLGLVVVSNLPMLAEAVVTGCLLFVTARTAIRMIFLTLTTNRIYSRSLLIAGAGSMGQKLARSLASRPAYGFHVVGFLDDDLSLGSPVCRGLSVLGSLRDVRRVVAARKIDEVVVCMEREPVPRFLGFVDACASTRALVNVASAVYGVNHKKMFVEEYGEVPVVGVSNFSSISYAGVPILKRLVDIIGAGIAIILLLPIFAIVALLIKLGSPGPVFYTQTRIGKNGKPFKFLKFRSMKVGSDADKSREKQYVQLMNGKHSNGSGSAPTKIVDESKVTSIGRLIRKTSIDELPQLLHVLTGKMSLVGPRPCLPYEWNHYEDWHKKRLDVTPGCTGVWQVLDRSRVGFKEMVLLDLFYIGNISFHIDLWLILKTIPTMLFGRGGK